MAEFKPGDTVRYIGCDAPQDKQEPWLSFKAKRSHGWVESVNSNGDLSVWFDNNDQRVMVTSGYEHCLELVEHVRPLIGPTPENPPIIQSPFRPEEDEHDSWIVDAHGNPVLAIRIGSINGVNAPHWAEFGEFVAEALNEKVNREEAA